MAESSKPSFPSRDHRTPSSSTLGIVVFSTLRLVDPIIQHSIITRQFDLAAFLPRLLGGTIASAPLATSLTDVFNLPTYHQLVLSMCLGGALKHAFWATSISQQEMPAKHAVLIAVFNTLFNSLNTIFSIWSVTCPCNDFDEPFKSPSVVIGTVLYAVGLLTEVISEIQRKQFKQDPANAGKPYSGGLFGLARHINYAGYLALRTGYALATGGPVWGLITGVFFGQAFARASIPELDGYCQKRVPNLCYLADFSMEPCGPRSRKKCRIS